MKATPSPSQPLPIRLAPDAEVPSFEALETQPLYGKSDIFPDHPTTVLTREVGNVAKAGDPPFGSAAHRLIRGVRAIKPGISAQEATCGQSDETKKMLAAVLLQESLVQSVHKAIGNARGRRGSEMKLPTLSMIMWKGEIRKCMIDIV